MSTWKTLQSIRKDNGLAAAVISFALALIVAVAVLAGVFYLLSVATAYLFNYSFPNLSPITCKQGFTINLLVYLLFGHGLKVSKKESKS